MQKEGSPELNPAAAAALQRIPLAPEAEQRMVECIISLGRALHVAQIEKLLEKISEKADSSAAFLGNILRVFERAAGRGEGESEGEDQSDLKDFGEFRESVGEVVLAGGPSSRAIEALRARTEALRSAILASKEDSNGEGQDAGDASDQGE